MKKIKIIRKCSIRIGQPLGVGEILEVKDDTAESLAKQKYAIILDEKETPEIEEFINTGYVNKKRKMKE